MDTSTSENRQFPAAQPARRQFTSMRFLAQPAIGDTVEPTDEADGDDERYQRTSRPVFI